MKRTTASQPGIEVKGLTKQYSPGAKPAVKDVSISVRHGEVYGFLGPNGAGKSTTIKLLMDFIRPTSGSATILGLDTVRDSTQIKNQVGYLSGDIAMYSHMNGRQFLSYMRELQPMQSDDYMNDLLNRLKVDITKKLGELSRGNRQKVAIVQAFMHKPQVLILDEPTSGLDPLMQEVFYELVAEAKARQAIVFMSSHIMSEIERTCDRVGIIRDGVLVDEFIIADLLAGGGQIFSITFIGQVPLKDLKTIKGLTIVSSKKHSVEIKMTGQLSPLFAILASHEVNKLKVRNLDIEDTFMQYYQDGVTKI